jgi:hypothetical protein
MDPQEPFLTEEFFRYSAECRRLARLARQPVNGATQGSAGYRLWIDWLGDIHAQYISPLTHRPQPLVSRTARR